jgi:hypothetical protein
LAATHPTHDLVRRPIDYLLILELVGGDTPYKLFGASPDRLFVKFKDG